MSRRWPATAKRSTIRRGDDRSVHTRYVEGVTIRPLQNGDTAPAAALLGRPQDVDPASWSRVDRDHHVLVAYLDGDPRPAAIARLVRDGSRAELACAVADADECGRVGAVLTRELAADARAAGVTELRTTV
jgi:hypothetical protein